MCLRRLSRLFRPTGGFYTSEIYLERSRVHEDAEVILRTGYLFAPLRFVVAGPGLGLGLSPRSSIETAPSRVALLEPCPLPYKLARRPVLRRGVGP